MKQMKWASVSMNKKGFRPLQMKSYKHSPFFSTYTLSLYWDETLEKSSMQISKKN